jgi:dihydroorotate dehydrogenase electron transfer subunit
MKAAQIKAKIISHQRLSGNFWHLEFESGLIAKHAVAGQFVNIRVADALEPLLRRPISIHGIKAPRVKIIYEILGKGTQILSARKPGEFLDVIGPLGNGFVYPRPAKHFDCRRHGSCAAGFFSREAKKYQTFSFNRRPDKKRNSVYPGI